MGGDLRKLGFGIFRGKRDGSRLLFVIWKWLYSKYMYIRKLVCFDGSLLIYYIYV